MAWWDLTRTAKDFQAAGTFQSHLAWLLVGLGLREPKRIARSITLDAGYAVAKGGRATLRVGADTLLRRVEILEAEVTQLHRELAAVEGKADERADKLAKAVKELGIEQRDAIQKLEGKVQALAVGGHDMLVFGLIYVAIGTIIAALSPELASAAHGQWGAILSRFQ